MSEQNPHQKLWDTQQQLAAEYRRRVDANESTIDLGPQINANVQELVAVGEVEPEDAWSLALGDVTFRD